MSGDSKIGISVGGVSRITPVRQTTASTAAASTAPARGTTSAAVPGLIRLASELAGQPVPVDGARVAALRGSIAAGSYTIDPARIAGAMIDHLRGNAD